MPIYVGQSGESPVCKFRFQVFRYDVDGYGNWKDYFFSLKPSKYGTMALYEKMGDWKEYFSINEAGYETNEEYVHKEK